MFRGANDPNMKLRDESGVELNTLDNQLYVVIFLHQFEDGQYCFGYDGFDDIYDWTLFTIDALLDNLNVSKIFIKSHPNASNAKYPGDEIAIKKISSMYKNYSRIVWLDSACGPLALKKNPGTFVGITKHGTIVEELGYIGIFSISSVCSRWTDVYKFSKIWNNKEEYKNIISSLSVEIINNYSKDYKDDLYKYINDYRFKAKNMHERQAWTKFAYIIYNKMASPLDFNYYNDKLSGLIYNSIEYNIFIEYLISCNLHIIENKH
jgi:hypothetical protein